jgi:serine/threonine-protein kinase
MDPLELASPTVIGRYALYGAIGQGGMATVHLGRLVGAEGFGRTVAIKRLRPHCAADPAAVLAFLDEAWLATRIRHPNVVSTLDVVTERGEAFLVMDYVDGESLALLLKRSREAGVPTAVAVAIVAGALRGLRAAHDAVSESGEPLSIVHRDFSPQNILVGVDGIPRVLDFGIAKAIGRRQTTRNGELKGKLAYMSPEQLTGIGVTHRTDLFAAGIVLWELLARRRLFRGDHEGETVTRTLLAPVPPPSSVSPSSPPELDAVVMRALEREPSKRFATAGEMIVALENAMTPATTHVVGEWVQAVAGESLRNRALQVRAVETHATTGKLPMGPSGTMKILLPRPEGAATDLGTSATVATYSLRAHSLPRRRIRRLVAVGVLVASVVGLAALAWCVRSPTAVVAVAAAAASSSSPSAPPAPLAPSAESVRLVEPPPEAPLACPVTLPLPTPPAPSKPPGPVTRPPPKHGGKLPPLYSRD